jgi:serine/threonine-protein kinase RsbW
MEPAETFTMTSDAEELVRMRSWLWTALVGLGVPLGDCAALVLAVGELCNNSIEHAYQGVRGRPVHVRVQARPGEVVIEVEDFGKPFAAERYREPDLDTVPEGGLGLFLVRTIVDRMSVDVRRPSGTLWTLVKRRAGETSGGSTGPAGCTP